MRTQRSRAFIARLFPCSFLQSTHGSADRKAPARENNSEGVALDREGTNTNKAARATACWQGAQRQRADESWNPVILILCPPCDVLLKKNAHRVKTRLRYFTSWKKIEVWRCYVLLWRTLDVKQYVPLPIKNEEKWKVLDFNLFRSHARTNLKKQNQQKNLLVRKSNCGILCYCFYVVLIPLIIF